MIWCAEHDAPIWFNETQLCSFAKYGPGYDPSPCRMTEALLIVKENGEWPEWVVTGGQTNGGGALNLQRWEVIAALDSIADSLAPVGDSL